MKLYKPELITFLEELEHGYYLHYNYPKFPISHIARNKITLINKRHLHKIFRKQFLGTIYFPNRFK
jgi:hypothetical protein